MFKKIFAFAAATAFAVSGAMADTPKYIFYFIGDGMGIQQVMNGHNYSRHCLHRETPLLMTTFPVASFATNYSSNSDVTDSAAAGTALSTGHKTNNGVLGLDAAGDTIVSVAKYLFDQGYGVGIVTSVAIDDATPAAFYTHVPSRGMFYEIGKDLAECEYQFTAGAALRGTKNSNGELNDLLDRFPANNRVVSYGLETYNPENEKVLILNPKHIDKNNCIGLTVDSIEGALTLPELTRVGLAHMLKHTPEKFFMMVEGGNIDHTGHGNDGSSSVREVVNFDDAIRVAYDFYLQHPDETLIVVTADHETGGMSVGCAATGYSAPVWNSSEVKISKENFNDFIKGLSKSRNIFTWEDMQDYMKENFGFYTRIKLNPDEEERLKDMFEKAIVLRNDPNASETMYANFNGFANLLFDIVNYKSGFGWTTPHHTGAPIPVFAIGQDAMLFSAMHDNTDLPKLIGKAAGVEVK